MDLKGLIRMRYLKNWICMESKALCRMGMKMMQSYGKMGMKMMQSYGKKQHKM